MISDYQPNHSFFREGAERFKTVLQGGTPDRVPVAAQMHGFSMKEKGANAKDFYTKPPFN